MKRLELREIRPDGPSHYVVRIVDDGRPKEFRFSVDDADGIPVLHDSEAFFADQAYDPPNRPHGLAFVKATLSAVLAFHQAVRTTTLPREVSREETRDRLVQAFSEHARAQAEASFRGDATAVNRHAMGYVDAFEALRALGDEGRDALAPSMHEGTEDVRVLAAAYLLRHRHEEARRVLEELSKPGSRVAFSASETLKRWDEGTWALDPAEAPRRIRDIRVADVLAGKVWRVVEPPSSAPYPDLVDLEIETPSELGEEDQVVYSTLAVLPAEGRARAMLLIREVGTYEWWGDTCERVDGAWRDGLSAEWADAEFWVAAPSPKDPSFMGDDAPAMHRAGFERWRHVLASER